MEIVYTAGVWDQIHTGHLNILRKSKNLGDILIVGVVTDLGAAAYKPHPPLWNEHHRIAVISALDMVDAAFLQPGTDPSPVLRALSAAGAKPSVMTHGDDWDELREGQETLIELGIEWELIPYTPDISTTQIREALEARVDVQ